MLQSSAVSKILKYWYVFWQQSITPFLLNLWITRALISHIFTIILSQETDKQFSEKLLSAEKSEGDELTKPYNNNSLRSELNSHTYTELEKK